MSTVQIKHRHTEKVLFEREHTSGMTTRDVLEAAIEARANLRGANLRGADLCEADLCEADLCEANLQGANLREGHKLIGKRPFLSIGPIGSRSGYLQAWITNKGVMIRAGCFFGTQDEFAAKVTETHVDNNHAQEYLAALALIDKHAELWTLKATGGAP